MNYQVRRDCSARDSGLGGLVLELKAELVSYTREGSQWKGSIFVIVTVVAVRQKGSGYWLLECALGYPNIVPIGDVRRTFVVALGAA